MRQRHELKQARKQKQCSPHLQDLPLSRHAVPAILGLRCDERPELPDHLVKLAPSVFLLPPRSEAHHACCVLMPSQFPNRLLCTSYRSLARQS